MKEIAIIMTVHNRKKQTIECLNCLYKESTPFDVYLTNDGCTDGTKEEVERLFPDVNVIDGNGDLFWNRGMYTAFAKALDKGYRFYLWLNDDTNVVPGFLQRLVSFAIEEGEQSILCGACVDNDDHSVITYGGFSLKHTPLPLSEKVQECSFASGNIFFIPKTVAAKLGNLDFYYRHSMGDFDYAVRARKAGIKIYQLPSFLGYCKRHYSIPKWRDVNYNFVYRLKYMYSPLGQNPFELWHCDKKFKGVIYAICRFLILHVRCLFPKLWGKKYNETI